MKKIGKMIKGNIKVITAFILGLLISGTAVYAATTIASSNVTYTSNSQSTVQGALDTLYTRANTWIDPSTIQINGSGKIFASPKGIVIRRNGATHIIKNNWDYEQKHIQQVFSDVGEYSSMTELGCYGNSDGMTCIDSDFYCTIISHGDVYIYDKSDYSGCYLYADSSVTCS